MVSLYIRQFSIVHVGWIFSLMSQLNLISSQYTNHEKALNVHIFKYGANFVNISICYSIRDYKEYQFDSRYGGSIYCQLLFYDELQFEKYYQFFLLLEVEAINTL